MTKALLNFVTANYIKLVVTAIVLASWIVGDISLQDMFSYVEQLVTRLISHI